MNLVRVFEKEPAFLALLASAMLLVIFDATGLGEALSLPSAFLISAWLIGIMAWGGFALMRHAQCLALELAEPYGTLLVTLAAASLEIVALGVILSTQDADPALGRDTMFALIMIVLNGLVGFGLLIDGWRHGTREYDFLGANAALSVMIAIAVFGLIIPNFAATGNGPAFSDSQGGFLIVTCLGLYAVYLATQAMGSRAFFLSPSPLRNPGARNAPGPIVTPSHPHGESWPYHAGFGLAYLVLIILSARHAGIGLDRGLGGAMAAPALGALALGALALAPRRLASFRAALANDLQRSIAILLGSVLTMLALTIPALVVIGRIDGVAPVLGLDARQSILLGLTLVATALTLSTGRGALRQGVFHLILFAVYLGLVFLA